MGRDQKTKEYTTPAVQARIAGLVKFSPSTRARFATAAAAGTALLLEHVHTLSYRGAQLWQLGTAGVVAWIDGQREGIHVYTDVATARENYARVCDDLRQLPPNTHTRPEKT